MLIKRSDTSSTLSRDAIGSNDIAGTPIKLSDQLSILSMHLHPRDDESWIRPRIRMTYCGCSSAWTPPTCVTAATMPTGFPALDQRPFSSSSTALLHYGDTYSMPGLLIASKFGCPLMTTPPPASRSRSTTLFPVDSVAPAAGSSLS